MWFSSLTRTWIPETRSRPTFHVQSNRTTWPFLKLYHLNTHHSHPLNKRYFQYCDAEMVYFRSLIVYVALVQEWQLPATDLYDLKCLLRLKRSDLLVWNWCYVNDVRLCVVYVNLLQTYASLDSCSSILVIRRTCCISSSNVGVDVRWKYRIFEHLLHKWTVTVGSILWWLSTHMKLLMMIRDATNVPLFDWSSCTEMTVAAFMCSLTNRSRL
jgi:hypothetical protein